MVFLAIQLEPILLLESLIEQELKIGKWRLTLVSHYHHSLLRLR
jgi:hypothetical protein